MVKLRRSIEFWLQQILWSADRLKGHIGGRSPDEFGTAETIIDATSWCISCVGEACGKILEIAPDFEDRNPALQIRRAYAARNRYVHGYFDVDTEQIWETATQSVPLLSAAIREYLADR